MRDYLLKLSPHHFRTYVFMRNQSLLQRRLYIAGLWTVITCVGVPAFSAVGDGTSTSCVERGVEAPFPFKWKLTRHSSNPVLNPIDGTWEDSWFGVSYVTSIGDRMHMYYRGAPAGQNKDVKLGLATSSDGVNFERYKGNPILTSLTEHFLRDVRVYDFDEGEYRLYYSDGDLHFDLAFSTDGIQWENFQNNPVMTRDQDWESRLMQPSLLRLDDGKWWMWYSTYRGKPRVTGAATSKDGIHWVKYEDNPVLPLGNPGEWDDYSAFQPFVFLQDGYFHMIYTGSSEENETGYAWGYAISKDGVHWTKSPDNPIVTPGEAGSWDAGKVATHILYRTGPNRFNIYYSGAKTPKATYRGVGLIQAELSKVGK